MHAAVDPDRLQRELEAIVGPRRVSLRGVDLDTYARDMWPRLLLAHREGIPPAQTAAGRQYTLAAQRLCRRLYSVGEQTIIEQREEAVKTDSGCVRANTCEILKAKKALIAGQMWSCAKARTTECRDALGRDMFGP